MTPRKIIIGDLDITFFLSTVTLDVLILSQQIYNPCVSILRCDIKRIVTLNFFCGKDLLDVFLGLFLDWLLDFLNFALRDRLLYNFKGMFVESWIHFLELSEASSNISIELKLSIIEFKTYVIKFLEHIFKNIDASLISIETGQMETILISILYFTHKEVKSIWDQVIHEFLVHWKDLILHLI